jgi:hypothetical protein
MGSLHTLSTPIAAFVKTVTLPSLRHSKCAGDTLACEATAKGLLTCCNAKLKLLFATGVRLAMLRAGLRCSFPLQTHGMINLCNRLHCLVRLIHSLG